MKRNLKNNLNISDIIHGYWRLTDWNISGEKLLALIEKIVQLGITTFDHADIYGNYECEKLFGNAISLNKSIRSEIQIITKCGIKIVSDKYPERGLNHYDYSYHHIISSVENSLQNFKTDYIDLLLLHRPSPFFDTGDVAKAFNDLKTSGKVLHFGVSNFTPGQYQILDQQLEEKLVTNQVEISPYCLEHFENGNMDFFIQNGIKPMAWSPLAGGRLLNPGDDKGKRIYKCLQKISEELSVNNIDQVIYAWLMKHPAKIIPVVGTGKISHLNNAIEAKNINMSLEQWFRIYNSSTGVELP